MQTDRQPSDSPIRLAPRTVGTNDFAIRIATVNGTGSASANGLLMQAIFRMGIPISGKNVFPSNIQGLPTWYEVRVNRDGHTARTPDFDLVVAMNPQTYEQDVASVRSGGWLLYDSTWPMDAALQREDIRLVGVPLAQLCAENFEGNRTRILMKNIAYVGALVALIELDMDVVLAMLRERFSRKPHLADANRLALELGRDTARALHDCPLPLHLEPMNATADQVMIDGNTAAGLGCVFAGATVVPWYPITPSTSLIDAFTRFSARFRIKDNGERNYLTIQAEDELAAAGMTIGAAWAGARSFTSTSGAGLSLMSEFLGLAYYAEVGAVFFNVQRCGPSTGMPTRTQQGDIFFTAYASHGDTAHICLYPADPGECFTMARDAFDLAERFQTPVFVLSDLDIGMNDWMVNKLEWDDSYTPDRGKVLTAEQLESMEAFHRYLDVDGDEVPYRTLPGVHPKGAYFTRGSGHDKYGRYTEDSALYQEVVDRLKRKVQSSSASSPQPIIERREGAAFGIVTIGACDRAVREAISRYARAGITVDYMRIRAFPYADSVEEFLRVHEHNYVLEANRDGQLARMLLLETGIERERITSVTQYSGMPMSAQDVLSGIDEVRRQAATGAIA